MSTTAAVRIEVSGRVQGVFFRASTKAYCDQLGVSGWVRNLPNGNVLIHAQGTPDQLLQLKEWCKVGPENARVDAMDVQGCSVEPLAAFDIRR